MEMNELPQAYFKYIAKTPGLTPSEETRLFKKMRALQKEMECATEEDGRKNLQRDVIACRHALISSNMRLVISITKGFINRGVSMSDLVDEGTVGLIEAADRFDHTRGFRFSTYATWWVRQTIVKALGNQGSSLRLPIHAIYTLKKHNMVYSDLAQEYGRPPHLREISSHLRISEKKLHSLMVVAQRASSLDNAMGVGGGQESLIDERASREIPEVLDQELLSKTLQSALHRLTAKETAVIHLRYGLGNSPRLTLEETCRELGITRERVRQIQKKALGKMRGNKGLRSWKV